MNNIISSKQNDLKEICKLLKVKQLFSFGSVNTESFNDESDLDFLISFQNIDIELYAENFFIIHDKLQKLFSRKIDLITENSLKNPFFITEIEKTKKLIYAA